MIKQLELSWRGQLRKECQTGYFKALIHFLAERENAGAKIYPPKSMWFSAFSQTPFTGVKVVILGQDPYHGPGQAHGLCFSVLAGVKIPPSLKNIYKELERDLEIPIPMHGCLESWAAQGVLLLNTVLTVEEGLAGAHQNRGWEYFTDAVIDALNTEREGVVFMLWGAQAQKKGANINDKRHLVLRAPHPSPLSAHRGFIGCGHFSQANTYLCGKGQQPINWQLPLSVDSGCQLIP
ncbi:uracil-DNA glycosylase [Zhongshania guokunii]|uniref:Uracil-DNA glycosylase n=1 Tax=Zhongshania guokunii TaxID=641783 RepID=A0ABV3U284_9GAMM